MERCWAGDPLKRPLLGEVEEVLLDIKMRHEREYYTNNPIQITNNGNNVDVIRQEYLNGRKTLPKGFSPRAKRLSIQEQQQQQFIRQMNAVAATTAATTATTAMAIPNPNPTMGGSLSPTKNITKIPLPLPSSTSSSPQQQLPPSSSSTSSSSNVTDTTVKTVTTTTTNNELATIVNKPIYENEKLIKNPITIINDNNNHHHDDPDDEDQMKMKTEMKIINSSPLLSTFSDTDITTKIATAIV